MTSGSRGSICLLSIISRLHPSRAAQIYLKRVYALMDTPRNLSIVGAFSSASDAIAGVEQHGGCRGFMLLVGSGGTEADIVEFSEYHADKPLVLIGHSEWNSLPAMLEAYSLLSLDKGIRVYPVYADLAIWEGRETLKTVYRSLSGVIDLLDSRLALIGKPSQWLVYSTPQHAEAAGVKLFHIPIEEFLHTYSQISDKAPPELAMLADERVRGAPLDKAFRVYLTLKKIVEKYGLDGLTVECFKMIELIGVTPCFALSLLNSEGVTAGCEGDVPGLMTMHLISRICGCPVMMGNISKLSGREIVVSHCTAPLAMGDSYRLTTHFETGHGVGVEVRVPKGRRVTLVKLDFRRGILVAGEGKVLASGSLSPKMCRTQVHLQLEGDAEVLMGNPVGSHVVLASGSWKKEVEAAAGLLGLKPVFLG